MGRRRKAPERNQAGPGVVNIRTARSLHRKVAPVNGDGQREPFKPWARTSKLLRDRGTPVGKLAAIIG